MESPSHRPPVSVRDKRLWTFTVLGGNPCGVHPKGNFPERHEGGRSVFKLVLTQEKAQETKVFFENEGCEVHMTTEAQTPEQKLERQKLAGAFKDEAVFPCEKCPACAFFDPVHDKGYCGVQVWPPESVSSLLKHLSKARQDLNACPLGRGRSLP